MGTGSAGKAPTSYLRLGIAVWSISLGARLSCSHGGCRLLAPGTVTLSVTQLWSSPLRRLNRLPARCALNLRNLAL